MFVSRLDVYGQKILVECFDSQVKADLDHDFSYFVTKDLKLGKGDLFHVRLLPGNRRSRFWIPLLKTKRSILYASPSGIRRVCFFNSVWLDYSAKAKHCTLYSDDPSSAYEAIYFVLLSYLGEQLGLQGLHRIHGMGFRFKGQGVVLLAPSGGGKSTLAMELLKDDGFHLVSDDTPVLNAKGEMLAFPQRIALNECPAIDSKFLRQFKRFNHSQKFVIGAEYFNEKIAHSSSVQWLMILDSSDPKNPGVEEVSRLKCLWPVIKWLVIGYETPQIWELVLRSGRTEIKNQAKILLDRLKTAALLVAGSRVAILKRGSTPDVTREHLSLFLNDYVKASANAPTRN